MRVAEILLYTQLVSFIGNGLLFIILPDLAAQLYWSPPHLNTVVERWALFVFGAHLLGSGMIFVYFVQHTLSKSAAWRNFALCHVWFAGVQAYTNVATHDITTSFCWVYVPLHLAIALTSAPVLAHVSAPKLPAGSDQSPQARVLRILSGSFALVNAVLFLLFPRSTNASWANGFGYSPHLEALLMNTAGPLFVNAAASFTPLNMDTKRLYQIVLSIDLIGTTAGALIFGLDIVAPLPFAIVAGIMVALIGAIEFVVVPTKQ